MIDTKEVCANGKSTDSLSEGICILAVNDDLTFRDIVNEMLRQCPRPHEVLQIGSATDVLDRIEKRKEILELILTNAHCLESDRYDIVQRIKEFEIPHIYKSPDKRKIAPKGQDYTFAAYIVFSLSQDGLEKLWQVAFSRVKNRKGVTNVEANSPENSFEAENRPASIHQKLAREEDRNSTSERSPGGGANSTVKKKHRRTQWTRDLHNKFLEAIEILGPEKAVPNKIVKIMNVHGLTRENVASHLQKHRDSRRQYPDDRRNEKRGSYPLQRNLINAQPCYTPFQRDIPYVNTQMKPFGAIPQMNNYPNLGSSGYINQNSSGHSQPEYIPRQQKFTLYDQDDLMNPEIVSFSNDINLSKNSSSIWEFVGLRLTNDGKSIEFGQHKVFSSHTTENHEFDIHSWMINDISQQPSQLAGHIQLNDTTDEDFSELFDFMSPSRIESFPNVVQRQDSMPIQYLSHKQPSSAELPNRDSFFATFEDEGTVKCPHSEFSFDQETSFRPTEEPRNDIAEWNILQKQQHSPPLPRTPQQMDDFIDQGKSYDTSIQVDLDDLDFISF